jgi:hypothetical protein
MSIVNRKMNVAVTVFITGDLLTNTETGETEVNLLNVGHSLMASTVGFGDAEASTKDFSHACASVLAKAGIAYLNNDLNKKHEEPPPVTNQPSANA